MFITNDGDFLIRDDLTTGAILTASNTGGDVYLHSSATGSLRFRNSNTEGMRMFGTTGGPLIQFNYPIRYTQSPANGFFLISDASGNATWQTERFGQISWLIGGSTVTSLSPANTNVKINVNSTTLSAQSIGGWDLNSTQNRLRYTGTRPGTAIVSCALTVTGTLGSILRPAIAKNGTVLTDSYQEIEIATNQGGATIQATTSVTTNDYFELWMASLASPDTVTALYGTLQARIIG